MVTQHLPPFSFPHFLPPSPPLPSFLAFFLSVSSKYHNLDEKTYFVITQVIKCQPSLHAFQRVNSRMEKGSRSLWGIDFWRTRCNLNQEL